MKALSLLKPLSSLLLGLFLFSQCTTDDEPTAPKNSPTEQTEASLQKGGGNCVPVPSDLVSWWPGDGNALDIVDGNNGTLQNGATFAAGMVDEAFRLDGIDDYVGPVGTASTYSFIQNTGVFTIDAWIKLDNHDDGNLHPILANTPTRGEKGFHFLYRDDGNDKALNIPSEGGLRGW